MVYAALYSRPWQRTLWNIATGDDVVACHELGEARAAYTKLLKAARKTCPRETMFVPRVERCRETRTTDADVDVVGGDDSSVDSKDPSDKQYCSLTVRSVEPVTENDPREPGEVVAHLVRACQR